MRLFIFGLGYSCRHLVQDRADRFSAIAGTVRSAESRAALADLPVDLFRFDDTHADPGIEAQLARADAILVSVPPGAAGDPALARFGATIAASPAPVVYLSTVGVYADHGGAWIDERAGIVADATRRGARARAEAAWMAACPGRTRILRLAGIYGHGRNALRNLSEGRGHRIVKPGQVFNRIHVADIVQAIDAAFTHAGSGIWNVCDDEPAPPQDVVTYAAGLMSIAPPPEQHFATAEMSPMARSFYASSNRIANARLKQDFCLALAFPDYRRGLDALWNAGEGRSLPAQGSTV